MVTRTKICTTCKVSFSYEVGRGNDRKHCSRECRQVSQIKNRPALLASKPMCAIPGCNNKATRVSSGTCEKHYYRNRRTGSTVKAQPKYRYETGYGYVKIFSPLHKLAGKDGCVREHRLVMYREHRGLCQSCFWCGVELTWKDAVIDHLNEVKNDNRIGNLVTACSDCNRARGAMLPFLRRLLVKALPTFIELAKSQVGAAQPERGRGKKMVGDPA